MKAKDLRNLMPEELSEKLKETQKHLFDLRFQAATDRLETPSAIRKAKRDIARMHTLAREHQLKTAAKS